MYRRIVLAYDGSLEGRIALREGALLGRRCGAQLFLLAVIPRSPMADALGEPSQIHDAILREGVDKAKELGFTVVAEMVHGDPVDEISAFARKVAADLVVVGHQRMTFLERWWSGSSQSYLIDRLDCSLLVARNVIGDEAFQAEILSRS